MSSSKDITSKRFDVSRISQVSRNVKVGGKIQHANIHTNSGSVNINYVGGDSNRVVSLSQDSEPMIGTFDEFLIFILNHSGIDSQKLDALNIKDALQDFYDYVVNLKPDDVDRTEKSLLKHGYSVFEYLALCSPKLAESVYV